jgi:HAD superfamily hydrolase (TIGR01509 family)
MSTYELVIFDCDGVLVESERIVCRVEAEELARHGISMSPDEARAAFKGRTLPEIVELIEQRAGGQLPRTWLYDWAMTLALGFVRELSAVRDVRGVLELLRERGQLMCVASQSPPARVALTLSLTELADFFGPRVYTASLVSRGKPAPDLFLYAAEQLGVAAESAVVIEDSASGVRAAVAAGMAVLGYAGDEDAQALADAGARVFTDMRELPALLGVS